MSTLPFSISPATYIRRIIARWIHRFIFPFIAVLILFAILGAAINPAFFIVALIFIFIIAPTALMIVYYNYGLTPRIVQLSHGTVTLSIDGDILLVTATRDDRPDQRFAIPISSITEISPGENIDTVTYGRKPDAIILIDKNAFTSQANRIQFHNYIFDRISNNSVK